MSSALQLLAQIDLQPGTGIAADLEGITIGGIIGALIVLMMVIAAVVFFFMLVIGGIKWIMSGGDKAQAESARNQITAALIGLVIVFAAWAIATLVNAFFGVNIFQLDITPASELST
jgi:cbb3-type cytochrome oxidase subunit 3